MYVTEEKLCEIYVQKCFQSLVVHLDQRGFRQYFFGEIYEQAQYGGSYISQKNCQK